MVITRDPRPATRDPRPMIHDWRPSHIDYMYNLGDEELACTTNNAVALLYLAQELGTEAIFKAASGAVSRQPVVHYLAGR
jgi:hypothetical protein